MIEIENGFMIISGNVTARGNIKITYHEDYTVEDCGRTRNIYMNGNGVPPDEILNPEPSEFDFVKVIGGEKSREVNYEIDIMKIRRKRIQ